MFKRFAVLVLLFLVSACAGRPHPQPVASAVPDSAAMVAAADAARSDGRFGEALEIYGQVLVSDPKAVAAQYGTAECLLALGKAGDAERIFTALQKDSRYHALALQGRGLVDLVLGRRDQAAATLHQAVAADPKLWRAYSGLGWIADLQRQPGEALKFYDQALAVQPQSAILLNNRGYSRLLAGKADEAAADFRKALVLDPDSETIRNNLRVAVASQGRYQEATRDVPHEKIPVVMNNVGYIAMKRGDLAAAEAYLSQAMTESPSYDVVAARNMDALMAMKGTKQ